MTPYTHSDVTSTHEYKFPGAPLSSLAASAKHFPTGPERTIDVTAYACGNSAFTLNADTLAKEPIRKPIGKLRDVQVTSIEYSNDGKRLGIGLGNGAVEVWDVETLSEKDGRNIAKHQGRVASLSWHGDMLSSGSSDGNILDHDMREKSSFKERFTHHDGEVCALKWRKDGVLLASGGNDNVVKIWDRRFHHELWASKEHKAAVKAIAWCPWQDSFLASGGGTKDGTINICDVRLDEGSLGLGPIWNKREQKAAVKQNSTIKGELLHSLHTGSQVTSVQWAPHEMQLLSTHGYSTNSIMIHTYPILKCVAQVRNAHGERVLFSAVGPAGDVVCTGSGDGKLKWWRIWKTPGSSE